MQSTIEGINLRNFVPEDATNMMTLQKRCLEISPDIQRYIEAYNIAFADQLLNVEELQHFMQADVWQDGTTFSAFAGDDLVGSVMVYYQPDADKNQDKVGATEYVFVHPDWRRHGIARYLLREAMLYLKTREMAYASLEVLAHNPSALSVYKTVGYTIHQEEVSLGLWLN